MKALIVQGYGQSANIGEIDLPEVKDGYLLVRMQAAAVNPFDYKLISGMVKDIMPITFPYVPGMDGAGVVVEVGAGADEWDKGDAVFGMFATGTLAQYALISAADTRLAPIPDDLDFERAAAIPEAGLTATTILRAANVRDGQDVLIIGATGGIGLFATQLAKAQGARVIATGKSEDADYLQRLGVTDVIDYESGDLITQVRKRYPSGVDVVVDLINTGDALIPDADVMRSGGTLVSPLFGPAKSAFPNDITVHYIQMQAQKGDLEGLARRAGSGELQVEIGRTYNFVDGAQALADLRDPAKHTRGKLIVLSAP
jgi:NADPH:quinone reductase-like Zn-dependent oxidoreductase